MKTIELTVKQQKLGKIARLMDNGCKLEDIANAVNEPVETVERLVNWITVDREKIFG